MLRSDTSASVVRSGVVVLLLVSIVLTSTAVAFAADEDGIAYLQEDSSGRFLPIYLKDGANTLADIDSITAPAISPDGSKIAFTGVEGDGSLGEYAIFTVNSNGTGLDQLTSGSYAETDPAWTPDGSSLIASQRSGSLSTSVCCRIVKVSASSGVVTPLTAYNGAIRPAVSPNGLMVAFDTPTGLYTMPIGGGVHTLRDSAGFDAQFSSDGGFLVYVVRSGSSWLLRRKTLSSGATLTLHTSTTPIESPTWVEDRVYFLQYSGLGYSGRSSVSMRSVSGAGGTVLTERTFGGTVAELSVSPGPGVSLVGDFDENDRDDIATYRANTGWWSVGDSSGSNFDFSNWEHFNTALGWFSHLAGDFDGDGDDDVANYHPSNGSWWVAESDGSSFQTELWATFTTNNGWRHQLVGDFNDDGRDDIANFHPSNGTWWISISTGSGFSTSIWANYAAAAGWSTQTIGDFNGDGRDDIANYYPANGTWWVSTSTGSGFTTNLWATFNTKSGWRHQLVGDFNDDGRDDIANYYPANGTWWVSISTGSGFVTNQWEDFAATTAWSTQAVGDFNGDGRDDIANYYPPNGRWWVSISTGTGFDTTIWTTFNTKTGWTHQLVGDYNNDGRDDIANYHPSNGTWWVSTSTGSSLTTGLWAD